MMLYAEYANYRNNVYIIRNNGIYSDFELWQTFGGLRGYLETIECTNEISETYYVVLNRLKRYAIGLMQNTNEFEARL